MKILSRLTVILIAFAVALTYNLVESTEYEIAVSSNLGDSIKLPVVMYHSFLKDNNYHGEFVISPEVFENDIKYLLDNGYTPISIKDLTEYIDSKVNLPPKPILITIDDGYYNNYLYAYPIAKKYNVKLVISAIGKFSELYSQHKENNAYYSHITWEQGKEMVNSGLVEFQNHTYDLHSITGNRKGMKKLPGESSAEYQKFLYSDLYKAHHLISDNFGCTPTAMTFPFGTYSKDADVVLGQLNYRFGLTSTEGINIISPTQSFYMLKRYNRPSGITTKEFYDKILPN